ncbi:RidA family protein [Arenibacter sp. GZD96]|uniref:RidA family protein n=1 Tax=Aurantibrevibacter litoralis TaxID=3106030 RepID=UPI002AFFB67C|nr:RidA family protein [Arenibacter sp. GZD-96]MEA1786152.1 RidA family protein [Arenibacter sp. GZD-96]
MQKYLILLVFSLGCAIAYCQKIDETVLAEKRAPVFTPSELPYPFSTAVQVGDILYLSGDLGAADTGNTLVPGGIEPETRQMFKRITATLAQHGLILKDVFKCTVMLADMSEWQAFNAIYATYFEPGKYPTRSAMGVNGLALGARVEMECWAWNPQKN